MLITVVNVNLLHAMQLKIYSAWKCMLIIASDITAVKEDSVLCDSSEGQVPLLGTVNCGFTIHCTM